MATPDRKMKNDTLGRERRRDLRERVSAIKQAAWRTIREADPPAVAAARKVIRAHEKRANLKSERKRSAILHAAAVARRKVLETDSFDEGLRVVAELEKTAKRRGWMED